jgi:hypothetical protein
VDSSCLVAIVEKSGRVKEETQISNTDPATIPKLKKKTNISKKIVFFLETFLICVFIIYYGVSVAQNYQKLSSLLMM